MKKMNIAMTSNAAEANVVTHPAPHHGDETTALAILAIVEWGVSVLRTRDRKAIEEAATDLAYVIDVGDMYDPEKGRYDHHQWKFADDADVEAVKREIEDGKRRPDGTKYSSAGLLWKQYGADACVALTGCTLAQAQEATEKVDEMLIRGIDSADYGIRTSQMSVSMAISVLNPNWNEPQDDESFVEACQLAYLVLTRTIMSCVAQVKGRDTVDEAIEASEDGIMILPQFIGGWVQTVLATTNPKGDELLYGVFQNLHGQWNVQAIPPIGQPQAQRKPLPETWRAQSSATLAETTGVQDAVFCHASGFMCGAKTREGAIKLARLAVEA